MHMISFESIKSYIILTKKENVEKIRV